MIFSYRDDTYHAGIYQKYTHHLERTYMINIPLFFGIVCAGIIFTILIWYTGKKEKTEIYQNIDLGEFNIFTFSLSIILFLYLIRLIFMLCTGMISQIYEITIIGTLCATIPLLILGIITLRKRLIAKV